MLVTGAGGYIGSVLVPKLLDSGYAVRVYDNLLFGSGGLDPFRDRIELVRGDILQPPAELMRDVYGVIHLAGVSSQAKASFRSPRYTDLMNHIGTEIIAKQAKESGVERFVLASSCSIYLQLKHALGGDAPLYDEESVLDISAPYALSKRASEEALFDLMDADFRPTMLRKGTVYGFAPKMRYDLVINAFTKDAFSKGVVTVHAGGEMFRPFVDIQDVLNAYVAALELPIETVGGQVFNVVRDNKKIAELARECVSIIEEATGRTIELDVRPFESTLSYRADNSKFTRAFGLAPARPLRDAIGETWKALEAGHDFSNPRYYNDTWYGMLAEQKALSYTR